MKHISSFFIVACFLLLPALCKAQQPTYVKTIYTPTPGLLRSTFLMARPDYGAFDFGTLGYQGQISRLDSSGAAHWSRYYHFNNNANLKANFTDAVNSHDSTFAVIGSLSNNPIAFTGFCMKLKANGDTIWCRKFTDNIYPYILPYAISATSDSGFVVCGSLLSAGTPSQCAFVARLTKNGTLSWMKNLGPSTYESRAYGIKQTADSGYVFTGAFGNSGSLVRAAIARLDKYGNFSWYKTYDIPSNANANNTGIDIVEENNGYLCLLSSSNYYKFTLLKTNLAGNSVWTKQYNQFIYPSLYTQRPLRLSKVSAEKRLISSEDGWVMLSDTAGNASWTSSTFMTTTNMVQCKNKAFMMIGNPSNITVKTTSSGMYNDLGVVVTDSLGNGYNDCYHPSSVIGGTITLNATTVSYSVAVSGSLAPIQPTIGAISVSYVTGCLDMPTGIEENSALATIAIYPNPSSGKITVQMQNPASSAVQLKLHDVTGRMVFAKSLETWPAAEDVELGDIKPGVYFYTLSTNSGPLKTGKLLISTP